MATHAYNHHPVLARIIEDSAKDALLQQKRLDVLHFFHNLLINPETNAPVSDILKHAGVQNIQTLQAHIQLMMSELPEIDEYYTPDGKAPNPSTSFLHMIVLMNKLASSLEYENTPPELFFNAIVEFPNSIAQLFLNANINRIKMLEASSSFAKQRISGAMKNSKEQSPISKYSTNLTEKAKNKELPAFFGRAEELNLLIHTLARKNKRNAILVGEPGVGKTALIEGLAQRIVSGDVPNIIKGKEILTVDISKILAGAKFRGELEERLKNFIEAVQAESDKYILFIDEFHQIVGLGKNSAESGMDASTILKPALSRGELSCIGATTNSEFRQYVEKDTAFLRRFQKINIAEPSTEEAISILRGIKAEYQKHHDVFITDEAIKAAVRLSSRYITNKFLPDKAIDLIDQAAALVKIELDCKPEKMQTIQQEIARLKNEVAVLEEEATLKTEKKEIQQKVESLTQQYSELENVWFYQMSKQFTEKEISRLISEADETFNASMANNNLEDASRLKNDTLIRLNKIQDAKKNFRKIVKLPSIEFKLFRNVVTEQEISEIIARLTNIPLDKISQDRKTKLLNLEDNMKKSIIGQDRAVKAVAKAVKRSQTGLSNTNKPTATFLFLGPTGVGKTELVKTMAKQLFNDEKNIIRIDMGEYSEPHKVASLIGAPPGYIGFESGGVLSKAVKENPYSIVLLDEIEKAHKNVFNLFLQIFDEGHLTDSSGEKINFKNTIIIMTSNLGAKQLQEQINVTSKPGFGFMGPIDTIGSMDTDEEYEAMRKIIMPAVEDKFSPEFINRIDEIVLFSPLSNDNIKKIVKLVLENVNKRTQEMNFDFTFDQTVVEHICKNGYNKMMGARPIKRFIENEVVSFLSDKILEDAFTSGKNYTINYKDANFGITLSPA